MIAQCIDRQCDGLGKGLDKCIKICVDKNRVSTIHLIEVLKDIRRIHYEHTILNQW